MRIVIAIEAFCLMMCCILPMIPFSFSCLSISLSFSPSFSLYFPFLLFFSSVDIEKKDSSLFPHWWCLMKKVLFNVWWKFSLKVYMPQLLLLIMNEYVCIKKFLRDFPKIVHLTLYSSLGNEIRPRRPLQITDWPHTNGYGEVKIARKLLDKGILLLSIHFTNIKHI